MKEIRMKRDVSCPSASARGRSFLVPCLVAGLAVLSAFSPGLVRAQNPDPKDWDLDVRADKASYKPSDVIKATAGIVARKAGVQGWSYGVKHDPAVMHLDSVSGTDGTDVPSVFNGGFNQTKAIEKNGDNIGYIQAIVLSFINPAEVPVSDYFKMALGTSRRRSSSPRSSPFRTARPSTST
jgi:hypothetical protein